MTATLVEVFPAVVETLVYGVGSLLFSVLGIYLENLALETVSEGKLGLGVWMLLMGVVALLMAMLVVTDKFYPKLTEIGMLVGEAR